jgi:hypothetical protein
MNDVTPEREEPATRVDSPRLLARDLDADAKDHYDSQSELTDLDHRFTPLRCAGVPTAGISF